MFTKIHLINQCHIRMTDLHHLIFSVIYWINNNSDHSFTQNRQRLEPYQNHKPQTTKSTEPIYYLEPKSGANAYPNIPTYSQENKLSKRKEENNNEIKKVKKSVLKAGLIEKAQETYIIQVERGTTNKHHTYHCFTFDNPRKIKFSTQSANEDTCLVIDYSKISRD